MVEHARRVISGKVAATLRAMGVDPTSVDGRTLLQLEKIEAAISSEADAYRSAKADMRSHMLTIDNISKVGGVSRPTIYAKAELIRYIERRRGEEKVFCESERVESLKARLRDAEDRLAKMVNRDGELVVAHAEIERLRERIRRLEEYVGDVPPHPAQRTEGACRVVQFPGSGVGKRSKP